MDRAKQLHPLDVAYNAYWNHPRSNPPADDLMRVVRAHALRLNHGDQDAAQDVCLVVISGLDRFCRRGSDSFSKWILSIAKRIRFATIRASIKQCDHVDYGDLYDDEGSEFQGVISLPSDLQLIAIELLTGDSIKEIASRRGVKPRSIEKKVERACRKMTTS